MRLVLTRNDLADFFFYYYYFKDFATEKVVHRFNCIISYVDDSKKYVYTNLILKIFS